MPLSCDVTEAILAAEGPATVDGKTVDTKTYEAACANGMGYFLISQDPGKPYGFSCFAADATRAADVAAGRAARRLVPTASQRRYESDGGGRAEPTGTNCAVRDNRWIGTSSKTNTEYNEVACPRRQGLHAVDGVARFDGGAARRRLSRVGHAGLAVHADQQRRWW